MSNKYFCIYERAEALPILVKALFFSLIFVASCNGCSTINKKLGFKDDNPIEEAIESHIEAKTGIDVDLTPETPENG